MNVGPELVVRSYPASRHPLGKLGEGQLKKPSRPDGKTPSARPLETRRRWRIRVRISSQGTNAGARTVQVRHEQEIPRPWTRSRWPLVRASPTRACQNEDHGEQREEPDEHAEPVVPADHGRDRETEQGTETAGHPQQYRRDVQQDEARPEPRGARTPSAGRPPTRIRNPRPTAPWPTSGSPGPSACGWAAVLFPQSGEGQDPMPAHGEQQFRHPQAEHLGVRPVAHHGLGVGTMPERIHHLRRTDCRDAQADQRDQDAGGPERIRLPATQRAAKPGSRGEWQGEDGIIDPRIPQANRLPRSPGPGGRGDSPPSPPPARSRNRTSPSV